MAVWHHKGVGGEFLARAALYEIHPALHDHQRHGSAAFKPMRNWSLRLARIAGIDVYVHATFFLVIAWIALVYWNEHHDFAAVVDGVGYILTLFACVVLHEFGHALTAARYGIRTRDITLLPIGGVARLERMPDVPVQELWVALAGPAVNVVIALLLFGWLRISGSWETVERVGVATGGFLERIMIANVALVGFNLLPAFPMDGGRALRALLAMRMEIHACHITRGRCGAGHGNRLRIDWVDGQSDPRLHRVVRVDRRRAGSEHDADEIRARRYPIAPGHAHGFPDAVPGEHAWRRSRSSLERFAAGLPSDGERPSRRNPHAR
jgi:Zn-dependent protease